MPRNQSEKCPLRMFNVPEILHPVFRCDARRALEMGHTPHEVEGALACDYVNASAHHFQNPRLSGVWVEWFSHADTPKSRVIVARLMEHILASKQK